jgi:hypothetical protein
MPDAPTFIPEPIPTSSRADNLKKGREPRHWEDDLSQLRTVPGTAHRVYAFATRSQAINRANAITKRWKTAIPLEHVTSAVRLIPAGKDAGKYGVWITWHGPISQAKRDELNEASRKRGAAVRESRARATPVPKIQPQAPRPTPPPEPTEAPRLTAAERVRAAAASLETS